MLDLTHINTSKKLDFEAHLNILSLTLSFQARLSGLKAEGDCGGVAF